VLDGLVGSGRSIKSDIGSWKISECFVSVLLWVWQNEGVVPNFRSLVATPPTSFRASESVYGLSLLALSKGLNNRSRKGRRVFVAPMSRMELIVTGRVELSLIYSV
jgi:hypothetical protein